MRPNPQFPAFTEEILTGKLHYLCSGTLSLYHTEVSEVI